MWWHDVVVTGTGRTAAPSASERFDPATVLGRKGLRYKDRASRLGMSAALLALADAGLPTARPADGPGTGVVVSSNRGNLDTVCRAAADVHASTVAGTSPMDLPNASGNVIASSVAIRFGLQGPNVTLCSGPGSGLEAVRMAAVLIGSGRAPRVVVIGVEPAGDVVAALLGVDEAACFDGACALVLEGRALAEERGARRLARLAGWDRARGARLPAGSYPGASGARGVLQTADAAESLHERQVESAVVADGVEGTVMLHLTLETDGAAL